jgi:hypothetical protein
VVSKKKGKKARKEKNSNYRCGVKKENIYLYILHKQHQQLVQI